MGSKKNKNQKNKKDMTIPDSATIIPNSYQEKEQKRAGNVGNDGLNDSTQSSF